MKGICGDCGIKTNNLIITFTNRGLCDKCFNRFLVKYHGTRLSPTKETKK